MTLLRGLAAVLVASLFAGSGAAAEHIRLGLVKVANSAPTYIAMERGYFAAEGLEPEIIFFEGGGQPIAVAVVSGDIDIGETATGAALFALAGQGGIRIISGETREAKTFHNFALAASAKGFAAGLRSITDLPGHSLAVPQVGSTAHYRLSLLADKYGFDPHSVRLLPLQSVPNVISAVKGGQADGTINAATSLMALFESGDAKLLAWLSDEVRFQSAVGFVATRTADQRRDMLERFLSAYRKGARDYHDAFTGPGEVREDGPTAPDILAIIAKYTGETPERLKLAIAYAPPDGGLAVEDIARQIAWFKREGMLKGEVDANAIIDRRYVIERPIE